MRFGNKFLGTFCTLCVATVLFKMKGLIEITVVINKVTGLQDVRKNRKTRSCILFPVWKIIVCENQFSKRYLFENTCKSFQVTCAQHFVKINNPTIMKNWCCERLTCCDCGKNPSLRKFGKKSVFSQFCFVTEFKTQNLSTQNFFLSIVMHTLFLLVLIWFL